MTFLTFHMMVLIISILLRRASGVVYNWNETMPNEVFAKSNRILVTYGICTNTSHPIEYHFLNQSTSALFLSRTGRCNMLTVVADSSELNGCRDVQGFNKKIDELLNEMVLLKQEIKIGRENADKTSSTTQKTDIETMGHKVDVSNNDVEVYRPYDRLESEIFSNSGPRVTMINAALNDDPILERFSRDASKLSRDWSEWEPILKKQLDNADYKINSRAEILAVLFTKITERDNPKSIMSISDCFNQYMAISSSLKRRDNIDILEGIVNFLNAIIKSQEILRKAVTIKSMCLKQNVRKPRSVVASQLLSDQSLSFSDTDASGLSPHLKKVIKHDSPTGYWLLKVITTIMSPLCLDDKDVAQFSEKEYSFFSKPRFLNGGLCFSRAFCGSTGVLSEDGKCVKTNDVANKAHIEGFEMIVNPIYNVVVDFDLDKLPLRKLDGICSLDNHPLKNCKTHVQKEDKFTFIHLGNKWHMIEEGIQLVFGDDSKELYSYTCSNCTDCMNCDGDDRYIKNFKPQGKDKCRCDHYKTWNAPMLIVGGRTVKINALMSTNMKYTVEGHVEDHKLNCKTCKVSCDQNNIIEYNLHKGFNTLRVCKGLHCHYHTVTEALQGSFDIRDSYLLNTEVNVTALSDTDYHAFSKVVYCKVLDPCLMIDCQVCMEKILNPHCYSVPTYLLVFSGLLAMYLTIALLYHLMFICSNIVKIVSVIVKLSIAFFYKVCKKTVKVAKDKTSHGYRAVDQWVEDSEEMQPVNMSRKAPRPMRLQILVISTIIVMLLDLVVGCSKTSTMIAQSKDCLISGNGVECTLNNVLRLSVAPIGQETCLTIKSETGMVIHTIKLTTKEISVRCKRNDLYFTNDYSVSLNYVVRCYGAGLCDEAYCNQVNKDGWSAELPESVKSTLGEGGCKRVNGFWGNSCFRADDACGFYKVVLKSEGPGYSVSSCETWEMIVRLVVSELGNSKSESNMYELTPFSPTRTSIGKISLISISIPPVPILGKCIIQANDAKRTLFLSECNKAEELIPGRIGEVQCPSLKDAMNLSKLCSYNTLIHKIDKVAGFLDIKSQTFQPSHLHNSSKLPYRSGDLIIDSVSDHIEASIHNLGVFEMQIDLASYKVEVTSSKVVCDSSFLNLTGCYNCNEGAKLCFKSIPTSFPAVAIISCKKSAISTSVLLQDHISDYCTMISVSTPHIDEACTISCSNEQEINIKGDLIFKAKMTTLTDESDVKVYDVIQGFSISGFSFFQYIKIGLFIIISGVIAWILFATIKKWMCSYRRAHTLMKYQVE